MVQSNSTYSPSPVDNGNKAREGPKTLRVDYDFSAGVQQYTTDIVQIKQQGKMSLVQSVFVDNTTGANNQPVTINVSGTNQSISVPSGYQGVFPLLVTDRAVFTVNSAGNGKVSIYLNNFEIAPFQWAGVAIPFNPVGTLTVTDPILDATVVSNKVGVLVTEGPKTIVDRSGTIAVGNVSQQIMAANPARQGWLIQNIDETVLEELRYNFTGAAATVANPGSFVLGASGGTGYPGGAAQGVGTAAITIIGLTAGHKYSAVEW